MQREKFSSRLGFLLISAGCAIGLGNVWRFPFVTGKYGGAAFVLIYLVFLIALGLPIMVMEFSVGRASQKSVAKSFDALEPPGSKWHLHKYPALIGNYLLMMFYTTIGGWMLIYCFKMISGEFTDMNSEQVSGVFQSMQMNPTIMIVAMVVVVVACFGVCSGGLQKGVEKITKVMMLCLLGIMAVLAVHSLTLPGAGEGLSFYLFPDFSKLTENGLFNAIFDAMGQAFFTLSIGMGSLAIFGSYIDKKHSLTGEAVRISLLDTGVALIAGLIIFPACFTFGVNPDSGPNLIFVTLPNVFASIPGGQIWGSLFFVFLLFAALSTIIAVFENIISCWMDLRGWSRRKTVLINLVAILILSLPCILGFNLWKEFQPFGDGSTILDLEDFLVSNNLLPLGSLVYLLFCTSRYGWGWKNFQKEANAGNGLKFPKWSRVYVSYILPIIVIVIFVQGYIAKFFPQLFGG
ncbi:Sodium:neurotransmitter symporter family protein [Eubacteriaceae bacterium CHKCI005]|nr:Sodium:neurotransmitter symporter family protein [Eubacteriaceae bacterium CHKCI005]